MRLIAQGAEAKLYKDGSNLIKRRIKKLYRIPEIDEKLRKIRTRKEAKVLQKLNSLEINSPKFIESSDKTMEIKMSFVEGKRVSEILNIKNYKDICTQIGKIVTKLHRNDIIHGDLTTSNFIYKNGKVFIIDFGLSFNSKKIEDKAVDLHLLKQALESKHYKIFKKAFKQILISYDYDKGVIKRLSQVEKRGRKKNKD